MYDTCVWLDKHGVAIQVWCRLRASVGHLVLNLNGAKSTSILKTFGEPENKAIWVNLFSFLTDLEITSSTKDLLIGTYPLDSAFDMIESAKLLTSFVAVLWSPSC